jgi:hypothetical protein
MRVPKLLLLGVSIAALESMTAPALLLRFMLGGVLVSLFAAVGSAFKPKTFAGLFGSAPPIALASLAIAFHEHGPAHVTRLGRSMVLGTAALFTYSVCCLLLLRVRELPVLAGAVLSWLAWAGVAAGLYTGLVR